MSNVVGTQARWNLTRHTLGRFKFLGTLLSRKPFGGASSWETKTFHPWAVQVPWLGGPNSFSSTRFAYSGLCGGSGGGGGGARGANALAAPMRAL
jgi:hypothetical protein